MMPHDPRATAVLHLVVSHLLARPGTLSLDAVSLFLMGAARVGFEHPQFLRAAMARYTPAAIACADFN